MRLRNRVEILVALSARSPRDEVRLSLGRIRLLRVIQAMFLFLDSSEQNHKCQYPFCSLFPADQRPY